MKDRVVQYPNRYQLAPVSGTTDTYDLTAVPGIVTEAGDNLNKANLLPDATATALGLVPANNPQIKDAFNMLPDSIIQIGDLRQSIRNNLGPKYLLCNGASILKDNYPDLFNFLNSAGCPVASFTSTLNQISASMNYRQVGMVVYNGTYVTCGYSTANQYPYIAYATNPTGPWTFVQLASTYFVPTGIACYNGTFVVCGNDGSYYPWVYYSTNVTTWTPKQISSTATFYTYDIVCNAGTFVIGGNVTSSYYGAVYYATTPSGTWTLLVVTGSTTINVVGFTYLNGTYILYGYTTTSTSSTEYYYSATLITGWVAGSIGIGTTKFFDFYNGTYIMGVLKNDNTCCIWSGASLTTMTLAQTFPATVMCIYKGVSHSGVYMILGRLTPYGYPCVLYGTNLTVAFTVLQISSTTLGALNTYVLLYSNNNYLVGVDNEQTGSCNPYIDVISPSAIMLPTISGAVYNYIKAL